MSKMKKENEEEVQENDQNDAFTWTRIDELCPLAKKTAASSSPRSITVWSKNEIEYETVRRIADRIYGKRVLLSHSPTRNEQDCRGVVEAVDYLEDKIEVTINSLDPIQLWADTDVWMFSANHLPNDQPHTSESQIEVARIEEEEVGLERPETLDDTILVEETEIRSEDIDQEELFGSINGWRYVGGTFRRMRRKCGEKWKSVYLTEMRMTPVDKKLAEWLEHVTENTALRLSDDIDEIGEVFVEVIEKRVDGAEKTITLGVTGFSRTDVNIPLVSDKTYYLRVDEGDDEDLCSLSSEEDVLPGYPLEQNVDELCEKLGELTVSDLCVRTWYAVPHNVAFIRIAVTTASRKLQHFKKLQGLHVAVQSAGELPVVLAVVSKVMKDELILTVKGMPREASKLFFFSKQTPLTIRVAHDYEARFLNSREPTLEGLQRQLTLGDIDIRFVSTFRKIDRDTQKTRTFATFTSKSQDFRLIPIGSIVLIGKCWEVEGFLERKAAFVFAVRIPESLKTKDPTTVTFEIKYTKTLVEGAPEFILSKAYYFVELDCSESIKRDPNYCLYDARSKSFGQESVLRSFPLGENFRVFINPFRPKPFINYNLTLTPKTPSISPPEDSARINPQKHRKLCCVFLSKVVGYALEHGSPLVRLRIGYNENGKKIKVQPWELGRRILLTEASSEKQKIIQIRGVVQDTKGEYVDVLVEKSTSNIDFLRHSIESQLLNSCYTEKR